MISAALNISTALQQKFSQPFKWFFGPRVTRQHFAHSLVNHSVRMCRTPLRPSLLQSQDLTHSFFAIHFIPSNNTGVTFVLMYTLVGLPTPPSLGGIIALGGRLFVAAPGTGVDPRAGLPAPPRPGAGDCAFEGEGTEMPPLNAEEGPIEDEKPPAVVPGVAAEVDADSASAAATAAPSMPGIGCEPAVVGESMPSAGVGAGSTAPLEGMSFSMKDVDGARRSPGKGVPVSMVMRGVGAEGDIGVSRG